MSHSLPSHRPIGRVATARFTAYAAYAAFASSVAFSAAIVFGLVG